MACLAILFNAFVPLLSHAAQAAAPPVMDVQVCTALGMTTMSVAAAPAGPADSTAGKLHKTMNHCGYCVAHATHGLPPPPAMPFAAGTGRDVYPPLYYHAPHPLFPWSLAQPRAPPLA